MTAFRAKFGALEGRDFSDKLLELAVQFLREHTPPEKKKEAVRA